MAIKIKKVLTDLEIGKRAEFPITSLASIEVTRDRIQRETNRRFSVKKVVIVERKKDQQSD
jgi:hypothetical protein